MTTPRKTRNKPTTYSEEPEEEEEEDGSISIQGSARAGFPPFEMTQIERDSFPGYVESYQTRYLDFRNYILQLWKKDPKNWLSVDQIKSVVKDELHSEIEAVWDFLMRYGYINVGKFNKWELKVSKFTSDPPTVIIIGAGAAGLACGQQLRQWGYTVIVCEARKRIGGRVNTNKELNCPVDLGASIITGLIGNPLDNLVQQIKVDTYTIDVSGGLLLTTNGTTVSGVIDEKMSNLFDSMLQNVSTLKDLKGGDKSLGQEMETLRPPLEPLDASVLDWYYANLEYACAVDLSMLSLNYWDQDDPYDFDGDHLIIKNGYSSLIQPLAEGLDIRLEHEVSEIKYNNSGVSVSFKNGKTLEGRVGVVTIPLGVLKKDNIKYEPPLPKWKKDVIRALGFGLINKVAIEFEEIFWEKEKDWFGKVDKNGQRINRGLFYLWWNYYKISGSPVLISLVVGKAGVAIEDMTNEEILTEAKSVIKSMFNLTKDPPIKNYIITRWKADEFAGGSYSYVALGATGEDYDKLAKPLEIDGKPVLFFGGEHTSKQYPATVAGAYASGLREAEKIHRIFVPPKVSMFRPPRVISDNDKTKEEERKEKKKMKEKKKISRRQKRYRRGIGHLHLGSGNQNFQFKYQPLFSQKNTNNTNTLTNSGNAQLVKYDALLSKKRRITDNGDTLRQPKKQKLQKVEYDSYGRNWVTIVDPKLQKQQQQTQSPNTNNNNDTNQSFIINEHDSNQEHLQSLAIGQTKKIEPLLNHGESEEDKTLRKKFREQAAEIIVNHLSKHHKKKIPEREDFKHLSRKFTHKVMEYEKKNLGSWVIDNGKRVKMKMMMDDYFKNRKVYQKKKPK